MTLLDSRIRINARIVAVVFLIALISNAYGQDCEPKTIDSMDSTTNWNIFTDGQGSTLTLNSVPVNSSFAVEMAFDISNDGWIGITKWIDPEILSDTTGIQFTYKGSGVSDNLQLKLIDKSGTNFGAIWNGATAMPEWTTIKVPFKDFRCLWCNKPESLELSNIEKIEFAVSNDGRSAGKGSIIIDDVFGITC